MEEKKQDECPVVSRFESDKAIMHLNFANRRMLIALVTVCLTFIITIIVFVTGYTAREKNWLDTVMNMTNNRQVVSDGIQQDTNN
ncbi:MAG: hypothetical protein J6Y60_03520 [Treponema sp.]|nr:hypothetical protein [Treponema sp.]